MIIVRGLAELLALVLNAVVVIIASRAVGPTAFGTFAVAATLGQIGIIAVNAGQQTLGAQAIANFTRDGQPHSADVARTWSVVIVARLALAFVVVVGGLIADLAFVADPQLRAFIAAVVVGLPFAALKSEWLLVAQGAVQMVALTRVAGALATAVLTIALIQTADDARYLPVIFITPLVTTALIGLVIVFLGKHLDSRLLVLPAPRAIIDSVTAGAHYLTAELSNFAYANSDRLFLFVFAGATVVGLYDAAYKLIQPFYAIASVVGDSMYRVLARAFGTTAFVRVFRQWVDLMCIPTIPIGFLCLAFAPWVIEIIYGPEFSGSAPFLAILGFAITFGYMAGIVTIPFTAWNAPAQYGRSILAGGLANLALNLLLIPSFGGLGAAIATVAAKITVGAWGYRTFRTLTTYPVIRDFATYGVVSALCVGVGVAAGIVLHAPVFTQLIVIGVAYIACVAIRVRRFGTGRVQFSDA